MRILRDPLLWLLALFIALLIGLPYSEPLFHTLFPEQPRPLYQLAGFLALTLAHGKLVVISSLAAIVIGVGAGVLVTRPAGREFRPLVETTLLQPVVGYWTDKYPMPWSLPIGMCFTLSGLVLLALAGSFGAVLLAAALVGAPPMHLGHFLFLK